MFPFKILLFSLALLPFIHSQNTCTTFISQLSLNKNNPSVQKPQEKEYFTYSGISGANDLGSKTHCEHSSTRKFFIIGLILYAAPAINTKGYDEIETGVCLPDFCQAGQLKNDPDLLKELCRINNWDPLGTLVLHDPNASPPRSVAFYVLATLFYSLVALCLISTFIQNKHKIMKKLVPKKNSPRLFDWLFKAFDVVGNMKSLYRKAKEAEQSDHLSMFGFIRICSMLWVIGFHAQLLGGEMSKKFGVSNPDFIYRFFLSGDIGPDYFFFMGGFLAAFTLANKASKDGIGIKNFFSDLMHRFFKIYPGAVVAILFYWIGMPGMINGTLWNRYIGAIQVCGERWTQKFFLYDNFIMPQPFDWCASWTWYIDVDFHVYPVIILLSYLFVWRKNSKYFVYAVTLVMIAMSFFIGMKRINDNENLAGDLKWIWYFFTPSRAGEPLIGVLFGFQYYEYSKLKQKKYNFIYNCERYFLLRYLSIAAGVFLNCYGILFTSKSTIFDDRQWEYMRRLHIITGTALMLMPLANNCRSIFKWFMNLRLFQVFGKLCFGAYLLHWPFILAIQYREENIPDVYDQGRLFSRINRAIVYAFIAAFIYHLVLEKPLLNIEAHFTKRRRLPVPGTAPATPVLIEVASAPAETFPGKDAEKEIEVQKPEGVGLSGKEILGKEKRTERELDQKGSGDLELENVGTPHYEEKVQLEKLIGN